MNVQELYQQKLTTADEAVKAEMTSAFLTACRMELHLMEAAWRGLTWEPVAMPR